MRLVAQPRAVIKNDLAFNGKYGGIKEKALQLAILTARCNASTRSALRHFSHEEQARLHGFNQRHEHQQIRLSSEDGFLQ